jgi:hypothetical protein
LGRGIVDLLRERIQHGRLHLLHNGDRSIVGGSRNEAGESGCESRREVRSMPRSRVEQRYRVAQLSTSNYRRSDIFCSCAFLDQERDEETTHREASEAYAGLQCGRLPCSLDHPFLLLCASRSIVKHRTELDVEDAWVRERVREVFQDDGL